MTAKQTAAVALCALVLGGCSSVQVVKNPTMEDTGIRYYRPKPYLLVTPADATGRMVKIEVLQLPDYCEEYSIHPRGKKPPAVQLKDGWNLVGVGGQGGPAPPPGPAAAPAPPPVDPLKLPEAVLVAGNVPIGLYESVFDYAGPSKFLKGWRYVGFSPWGGGGPPNGTDAAGTAAAQRGCPPCQGAGSVVQGPLYGIVFFNGAMTFRQIDEIGNNMTCPQYEYLKPPVVPVPTGTGGAQGGGARDTGGAIEGRPAEPPKPGAGGAVESPPLRDPVEVPAEPAPAATPPRPLAAPVPNPGPTSRVAPLPSAMPYDGGVAQVASQPVARAAQPAPRVYRMSDSLKAKEAQVFEQLGVTRRAPVTDTPTARVITVPAPASH